MRTHRTSDWPRRVRLALGPYAAFAALGLFGSGAPAPGGGGLVQKTGLAGCVSETGDDGTCADGIALTKPWGLAVSPDSRSVYVASATGGLAIFERDANSGALTQKPGTAGCVMASPATNPCDPLRGPTSLYAVAVSPDGKNVYATGSAGIAVFDRGPSGELYQRPGTDGCITAVQTTNCTLGRAVSGRGVAVSPDGRNVYVAGSDAVAVFYRLPDGSLVQPASLPGCVANVGSAQCVDGRALADARSVVVSPDNRNVYVASRTSASVTVFDRDPDTGWLSQKPGEDGCIIAGTSSEGCRSRTGVSGAWSVAITPDAKSVFVAGLDGRAVAIFERRSFDGALSQESGIGSCVCGLPILARPTSVAVTPDGAGVYVTSNVSDAVAVFDRDLMTRRLTQRAGTAGCVSATGTDGACAVGWMLHTPAAAVVSPDGANLYVAANDSNSVAVFDIDGVAPQTVITNGPATPSNDVTPSFSFQSEPGATHTCRVDAGEPFPCASPYTLEPEPDGPHTFAVAATDTLGNTDLSPASREFVVDTVPPETTITSGPEDGSTTFDHAPSFAFASSEPGSTFRCQLDTSAPEPCSVPFAPLALGDGRHAISVVATDRAQNIDPSPAARSFIVATATATSTATPETTATPTPTATPQAVVRPQPTPTPVPPPLYAEVHIRSFRGRTSSRVTSIVVDHFPSGATIAATCPRGCSAKRVTRRNARGTVPLKPMLAHPL